MRPRDRVFLALSRKEPDRPPKCSRLTPPVLRMFNKKVGAKIPEIHLKNTSIPTGFITEEVPEAITPDEYFNWDIRHVNFRVPINKSNFRVYFKDIPENAIINEWGVGIITTEDSHYVRRIFPLENSKPDPAIVEDYPFPNFMANNCHNYLDEQVKKIKDSGYAVAGFLHETVFEMAWSIRGFEKLLIDFMENQDFATVLLDKIMEIRCQMAERYAQAGVDIIRLGDDVGTQSALMMSPQMWRTWLKPRMAEVIRRIHAVNPEIYIFYHTDGYVEPLIEEFIEIGIDILNPVQPESMDPEKLKEKYGDRISFWGTIGTQTTMPFGTPAEIKEIVQRRIEKVGKGGGLVIAPTHAIQPDVPWENIIALFDAVEGK